MGVNKLDIHDQEREQFIHNTNTNNKQHTQSKLFFLVFQRTDWYEYDPLPIRNYYDQRQILQAQIPPEMKRKQ